MPDFSLLTDNEIVELEELYRQREVSNRFKDLREPDDKNSSPNYRALHDAIETQEWGTKIDESGKEVPTITNGYAGFILEGSSRSTKTWSGVDIIIWLCTQKHKDEGCTINIYRETYNEFKTTLYDDFKRRLDDFDLDNKFKRTDEVKNFKIGNSKIHFLGDGKHGGGCDYAFFNEAMMIKETVFKQVAMRCRKFWWMDYNPSYTVHWIFDRIETRADVGFLRTTFKDNPFIKPSELNEIVITEPWLPGSYYVEDDCLMYEGEEISDTNQPPPHPTNTENNTVDEFYWAVYGMGLRGAMKGVIYKKVTWIDKFPNIAHTFGLDFGFVADPSALVKYAKRGRNVYLQLLWYEPTETAIDMNKALKTCRVSKYVPITADSSDRYVSEKKGVTYMVRELIHDYGYEMAKVSKTKGLMHWVGHLKKFKIHIVRDLSTKHGEKMYAAVKKEKENYKMAEVQGILINEPEDKFNHFWDACFVEGTPVTTIDGTKPIEDIEKGDLVLTSKGYNRVVNTFDNGVKKISSFCLQFDTFRLTLCCTSNHKVKTSKGWIEISKLKQGMTVYVTKCLMVKSTSSTKESGITPDINKKCIGTSGNSTTDLDGRGITYTIKTKTHTIIDQKILKKKRGFSIFQSIEKKQLKIILRSSKNSTLRELRLRKNGTLVKKGRLGIRLMLKNAISEVLHTGRLNADNAVRSSLRKIQKRSLALQNAQQNTEEIQGLITKPEIVNTVGQNGCAADFQRQNAVQKCALVRIDSENGRTENVYDIEVENEHEYFANGLLVHNCRYAHMARCREL